MRVLVTGASGFAGAAVISALESAGHDVAAGGRRLDSGGKKFSRIVPMPDLSEPFDAHQIVSGFDAVVHLAGLAHSSKTIPESTYDAVNAEATRRLAIAARAAGACRFVLASSVRAQSGPSAPGVITETDVPAPSDAYGRSKLKAEHLACDALSGSRTSLVVLRPVLMYGPSVKGNMALLVRLARTPWPLPLGGLKAERSLLGLDNFASAVRHALAAKEVAAGTYLVADDEVLSVADVVAALRSGLGRAPGLLNAPLPGVPAALRAAGKSDLAGRLFGDLVVSTAALRWTGWRPDHSTFKGLTALMQGT